MKKIIQIIFTIAISFGSLNAQFFELTDFTGALSPDSSKDWTKGWTNWTPQSTEYPAVNESSTLVASAGKLDINGTVTLNETKVYLLKGLIVIRDGGKLVIPGGTIIRCEADLIAIPKNYASIVVERGGKIEIKGTPEKPVVFTSNKPAGTRSRGDWGGLIVNGKATNNQGNDVQVEGFNNVSFDPSLAKGGGTQNDDNSGIIQYCRFEFGGIAFEANKEINGVTFNSVGNNTKIEGLQVSYCGDDAFEWFGGTVNCKKLIAYKTTDDDFDTDYGYRGAVQYCIGIKDTALYDLTYNAPSGSSTSEGLESDNDAGGSGKTPYTAPVFSNMTMIGPVPIGKTWSDLSVTAQEAFRRGVRIRRNSRLTVVNSIFMGYRNFVFFDGDSTMTAAGVTTNTFPNTMGFRNNLIVNSDAAFSPANASANGLVERSGSVAISTFDAWLKSAQNSNNINPVAYSHKTVLEDPQNPVKPVFRPVSSSPALSGYNFGFQRLLDFGTFNSIKSSEAIRHFHFYPNPAADQVQVNLSLNISQKVELTLIDISGFRTISKQQYSLFPGTHQLSLSTENAEPGIYLILLKTNDHLISEQIVISK